MPANRWISYTRAGQAIALFGRMLEREPGHIRPGNLLIVGATNNGKTAIAERFLRDHPQHPSEDGEHEVFPVLLVQMPPAPTVGRLYAAIRAGLGVPGALHPRTTPEIIANPDAARGLEQLLLEALVDCLGDGRIGEDRVAQRHHELIMRRFHRLLTQNPGRPLYIPEICKAIGVSERTLRVCCQEQFGIGPKHFLPLRRLHLVRRALREAASPPRTVTDIATCYGFWQFGLIARHYRSLFGEVPSATLNRPSS